MKNERVAQKNERMPDKLDFFTPTAINIFSLFLDDPMQEYYERGAQEDACEQGLGQQDTQDALGHRLV